MTNQEIVDQLEKKITSLLNNAAAMKVGLSDDESVYDLNYIRKKVTLAATYLERLSDIRMQLTGMRLQASQVESQAKSKLKIKEKSLKASTSYKDQPREGKTPWLENQLVGEREDLEIWIGLMKLVSLVGEAVGDRIQDLRRVDSDLRLHAQLFEQGVKAGATAPTSYTGSKHTEAIDLS